MLLKEKVISWSKSYFEKLISQAELKQQEQLVAERLFGQRITSMMSDYNIPMSKALLWDWQGFGADPKQSKRDGTLEEDFLFYLWQNNVFGTNIGHVYTDVFFGRKEDLVLKK